MFATTHRSAYNSKCSLSKLDGGICCGSESSLFVVVLYMLHCSFSMPDKLNTAPICGCRHGVCPFHNQLGDIVELSDRRVGSVRFVGPTAFASGIWYGIELEDATGKHDGGKSQEIGVFFAPLVFLF